MKLVIDTDRSQVSSATQQVTSIDRIASATRVFLGVSIGMGFIAAAAAFFIPADDNGGGGGSSPVVLKVASVTGAKSTLDVGATFSPIVYWAGNTSSYVQNAVDSGQDMGQASSNQVLKLTTGSGSNINNNVNGPTAFSIESVGTNNNTNGPSLFSIENTNGGGATTFSIEPGNSGSFGPELINVQYSLAGEVGATPHTLTLCIGYTTSNTLYVGTDGTTYTGYSFGSLSGPTTQQTCGDILAKALKPTDMQSSAFAPETLWTGHQGVWSFFEGSDALAFAYVDTGAFNPSAPITNPYAPLRVAGSAPGSFASFTVPRNLINLAAVSGGQNKTFTLCYPQTLIGSDHQAGYNGYYYDTQGNPYTDIFLQQPAMTGTCAQAIAKGLKTSSIESATGSAIIDANHGIFLINQGQMKGSVNGTNWNPINNNEPVLDFLPFAMVLGGGNATDKVNVPQITVTMKYNAGQSLSMCFPAAKSVSPSTYRFFYDTAGKAYKDIFLTQPVTCTTSGGGGGPKKIPAG